MKEEYTGNFMRGPTQVQSFLVSLLIHTFVPLMLEVSQPSQDRSFKLEGHPFGGRVDGLSPSELLGNGIRGLFHSFVGIRVTLSRDVIPESPLHLASQFSSSRTTVHYWCQCGVSGHFLWTQYCMEFSPSLRVSRVRGWDSCYRCFHFLSSTILEGNSLFPLPHTHPVTLAGFAGLMKVTVCGV